MAKEIQARLIDVRGLSCPQPVFLTKKAIDSGETEIVVIANDMVAKENIKRLAESSGYKVKIEEKGSDFIINIRIRSTLS